MRVMRVWVPRRVATRVADAPPDGGLVRIRNETARTVYVDGASVGVASGWPIARNQSDTFKVYASDKLYVYGTRAGWVRVMWEGDGDGG